tara:strand:- start:307 stop:483 length:177 start_codon:yes stop_codon:yes gene_type:complete
MGMEKSASEIGGTRARYVADGQDVRACKEISSPTFWWSTTACFDSTDLAAKTDDPMHG